MLPARLVVGLLAVAFYVTVTSASADCSRYSLYGLSPGMSPAEVRETMTERGEIQQDRKSARYYRDTSTVDVVFDEDIKKKSSRLVAVRSHIPMHVDPDTILRTLRDRFGDPTTGSEHIDDGLRSGSAVWVSDECNLVVEASYLESDWWDPTKGGIRVEARSVSHFTEQADGTAKTEDAVVDDLLAASAASIAVATPAGASAGGSVLGAAPPEADRSARTDTVPDESLSSEVELTDGLPGKTEQTTAVPIESDPSAPTLDGGIAIAGFGGVTYPERLQRYYVTPLYPLAARQAKITGSVHLRVIVLRDGTVGDAEVLRSSRGDAGFEESAIKAVQRWRYRPAERNGRPVDASILVRIDFK